MNRINLLLLLITGLAVLSCKKGEDNKTAPTKMELLTSATWKYEHAGLDLNKDGQMDTDLPAGYIMACDKDNTLTFKKDGTGIGDEGALKCDQGNPQTTAFDWTFKNSETVIHFAQAIFTGVDGDVTVNVISDTRLELLKEVNIGVPQTVNVVVKFKH